MGVDWRGVPRGAPPRGRAPLRRAGVVCAALVRSSGWPSRASRDRAAVGRAFQRPVDRQSVPPAAARWQRRLWARMEADVVRHADALVFVNEQTAERVMRKYPRRVAAQVARRAAWVRLRTIASRGCRPAAPDRRLTVVYTGRFYDGIRTPDRLLRALAALARRRPLEGELHVSFVGTPVGVASTARQQRSGSTMSSSSRDASPFAESARTRRMTPTSCSSIDAPADESLFLPSKLVDYLPLASRSSASRRPRGASADLDPRARISGRRTRR